PRTTTKALPAFWVSTRVMLGTWAMKSAGRWMPAARMASSVNTFTVIGTSRKDSSRLRAVTTISSRTSWAAVAGTAIATPAVAQIRYENAFPLAMVPTPINDDGLLQLALNLSADDAGASHHCMQLGVGNIARQVLHAAILR